MKNIHIQNILVPIDFSEMSIRSVSTAKHLARRFGSVVHLVHLHEFYYPAGFLAPAAPVSLAPVKYLEAALGVAEQRLRALAREHGLTGTCQAEIGGPVFDVICGIARQIPADLVVTATHGHTGLKHVLLGSTAERLVQHSPCPVWVDRQRKPKTTKRAEAGFCGIDTILVPIDFSRCSSAGLEYAIQFADRVAAKIVLLHVVDFGPSLTADGYAMYDLTKYQDMARADAERQMSQFVQATKFGGVKFKAEIVVAPSVTGICEMAKREKADLIITATHGRTGLKHVLIGSTAEVVVRHAPCPVLVVPSHPEVRMAHLTGRSATAKVAGKRTGPGSARAIFSGAAGKRSLRKVAGQPFPERRRTNKFCESHISLVRSGAPPH